MITMTKAYQIIADGNIQQFVELFKKQKNKHKIGKDGFHFLHYASLEGQVDIIDFLLNNGIDIDILSKDGYSCIVYAIINGHIGVVKYFLDKGYITKNRNGFLALITAAANNQLEILKILVESGLNINETDQDGKCFSPLHYACQEGNYNIVKFLIEKKAHVNRIDQEGLTPLRMAADWEHTRTVNLLLKNGADINLGDALHLACAQGHLKMIKFLLGKGANINAVDQKEHSPLFYAKTQEIKSFMLAKGAEKF